MRRKGYLIFILGAVLCFSVGCASNADTGSTDSTTVVNSDKNGQTEAEYTEQTNISEKNTSEIITSEKVTSEKNTADTETADTQQPATDMGSSDQDQENPEETGTQLYISTGNQNFQSFPFTGSEVTPDTLVQGIADLTGWNLNLADTISSGKGGMTVCFTGSSAIFTGPPEDQSDDFHVYDAESMVFAVLDSIQMTLQNYASSVNPTSVDIYFCMEGDVPIILDNLGVTIPMDQPYSHEGLAELFAEAQAS